MQFSSSTYRTEINGDKRKTVPLILCNFNKDLNDYPFGWALATSEQTGKEAVKAINGRIREWTSTGTNHIDKNLWTPHYGWWSENLSDSNGDMVSPEVLTIQYFNQITCGNFMVIGTETNYPVDFTIETSLDGASWTTIATVTGNTNYFYGCRVAAPDLVHCRISITKISAAESPVKVLQAGALVNIVFGLDDVSSWNLQEELIPDGDKPLGLISTNVFYFSLWDFDRIWKYDNTNSPFAYQSNTGFYVKPYAGIYIGGEYDYEYMPLGEFWVEGKKTQSTDLVVSFTCNDRLYRYKDKSPPVYRFVVNTTIADLFADLFSGLGIDRRKYFVSSQLRYLVPRGFFAGEVGSDFSGETVGECLAVLAEASNSYVTTDRTGRIVVRSNYKTGDPLLTITDDDQIFEATSTPDFSGMYDAVKIRYRIPQGISDEIELFRVEDITVQTGDSNPIEIEAPNPTAFITRVELEGATNTTVSYVNAGAVRSEIYLTNSGASETVNLIVYGNELEFFNTSYTATHADDPKATLAISNWLIQTEKLARSYADSLIFWVESPYNNYDLLVRGDPSLECGDIIGVQVDTKDIDEELQLMKIGLQWEADQGMSGSYQCRKPMPEKRWAMLLWPFIEEIGHKQEFYWSPRLGIDYVEVN